METPARGLVRAGRAGRIKRRTYHVLFSLNDRHQKAGLLGLRQPQQEPTMSARIELGDLKRLIDQGAQLVEVLPAAEYAEAHLPGAINIALKELDKTTTAVLDRSRPIVVYCYDYL